MGEAETVTSVPSPEVVVLLRRATTARITE
jgi:hypothetical protein